MPQYIIDVGEQGPRGLQGIPGTPGAMGPPGPQGQTGAHGTKFFVGAGPPSPTMSGQLIGDYYMDTTNFLMYGPWNGAAWGAPVVYGGPTGPKGDKGDPGLPGNATILGTPVAGNVSMFHDGVSVEDTGIAAVTLVPATVAEYLANSATKMLTPGVIWAAAAQVALVDAASVAPNLSNGSDFSWTAGAAGRTLANPTLAKPGQKGVIVITNSQNVSTFGPAWKFSNGLKPTMNGVTIVSYMVGADGTTMFCTAAVNMS